MPNGNGGERRGGCPASPADRPRPSMTAGGRAEMWLTWNHFFVPASFPRVNRPGARYACLRLSLAETGEPAPAAAATVRLRAQTKLHLDSPRRTVVGGRPTSQIHVEAARAVRVAHLGNAPDTAHKTVRALAASHGLNAAKARHELVGRTSPREPQVPASAIRTTSSHPP